MPPRERARELWRLPPDHLTEAQDDATLVVRSQEEAGLDVLTDPGAGDAGDGRRPASGVRWTRSTSSGWCSPATAG